MTPLTPAIITALSRHRAFIRFARIARLNNNPRFAADCLDMAAEARADYRAAALGGQS